MMQEDLKKWMNKCMADVKRGRTDFRGFSSDYIPDALVEEIEDQLSITDTKDDVYRLFNKYLSQEGQYLLKAELLLNEIGKIGIQS